MNPGVPSADLGSAVHISCFQELIASLSNTNSVKVQTNGKIIVGGEFTLYNGTSINRIVRLNSDGSIDNTFNIGTGFAGTPTTISLY